jgi:hypothetical protein
MLSVIYVLCSLCRLSKNKPFTLNVVMLNVVTLNVIMLNVVTLNVIMLNVVMLNVMAPHRLATTMYQEYIFFCFFHTREER